MLKAEEIEEHEVLKEGLECRSGTLRKGEINRFWNKDVEVEADEIEETSKKHDIAGQTIEKDQITSIGTGRILIDWRRG